ncbi:MAG: hypothetical protein LZF60_50167 [Nitrospira sp.]|nr:MAG: hypothetical protein LZF60_50167 [Nitrospira sp.]
MLRPFGEKEFGRVADFLEPAVLHFEHPDFIRRPEPVFHRPQDPETVALVAFEVQHRIDDMFQQAWARNRAFLRDMSDDEHGHIIALRKPHQLAGHFLHLADTARRRCQLLGIDRLNRIHDNRRRLDLLNGFENLFEGCLSENEQMLAADAKPFTPHLDLPGRLLAGDIQDLFARFRQQRQSLQQQGCFPNTGITPDQHDRTGHHAAAQDAIEFAHSRALPRFAHDFNVRDGSGHRHRRGWHTLATFRSGRQTLFFKRVPAAAVRAASKPARRLMAAGLTMKRGLRLHSVSPQIPELCTGIVKETEEKKEGWRPPIPVFYRLGMRPQTEIEQERYALKAMLEDFITINGDRDEGAEKSWKRSAPNERRCARPAILTDETGQWQQRSRH